MQNIEFLIAVVILSFLTYIAMRTPSHDRNWSADQKILPTISTYGDLVTVHNMRQARYRSVTDYEVAYSSVTFALSDITKVWFLIEPFGRFSVFGLKPAHVLLSFELADGTSVAISPEIRKRNGETFSALHSFLRYYEIMYVVADEEDVVQLRTNYRKDEVRFYPLKLSADRARKLFLSMAEKVNAIHAQPSFFNSMSHSCTTNVMHHLRSVGVAVPKHHPIYLLPSGLDGLLLKHDVIDTNLPLEKAREHFFITKRAQMCTGSITFSECIRSKLIVTSS